MATSGVSGGGRGGSAHHLGGGPESISDSPHSRSNRRASESGWGLREKTGRRPEIVTTRDLARRLSKSPSAGPPGRKNPSGETARRLSKLPSRLVVVSLLPCDGDQSAGLGRSRSPPGRSEKPVSVAGRRPGVGMAALIQISLASNQVRPRGAAGGKLREIGARQLNSGKLVGFSARRARRRRVSSWMPMMALDRSACLKSPSPRLVRWAKPPPIMPAGITGHRQGA